MCNSFPEVNDYSCRPPAAYNTGAVVIPPAAFADVDNPTDAEAQVYADTLTERPNTMFVYAGVTDIADYVWIEDVSGNLTRIESPPGKPIALIDIIQSYPLITTVGDPSYPSTNTGSIVTYEWTVTDITTGLPVVTITGNHGADASGEALVDSGNYENPTWALDECGDFEFCLVVTDDLGRVSEEHCSSVYGYGESQLVFVNDGGTFAITLAHDNAYVAHWDMGDGTTYDTNTVSHDYGVSGTFTAVATVCYPSLATIQPDAGQTTTYDLSRIFERLPIRYYKNLRTLNFVNANTTASGVLPTYWDWSDNTELVILDIRHTEGEDVLGIGFTGGLPSIANLVNLERYVVTWHEFSGVLVGVDTAVSLVTISVSQNTALGGTVDFSNCPDLVNVFMQETLISGSLDFSSNPLLETASASLTQITSVNLNMTLNPLLEVFRLSGVPIATPYVIPSTAFTSCPNLQELSLNSSNMTGAMPDLSSNTALVTLDLRGNTLTGEIPDMSLYPALAFLGLSGNALTAYSGGNAPATLLDVSFDMNPDLSSTENDDVFCAIDAAGSNNGVIEWGGTRTGTGDTCATNLLGRGWTITP